MITAAASRQLIRLRNPTDYPQELWLEPLGDGIRLEPGGSYEITVGDEFEEVEIEASPNGFVVYGWVTQIKSSDDGTPHLRWELPASPAAEDAAEEIRHPLSWRDLRQALQSAVKAGQITTYAEIAKWGYGAPHRNNLAVRSWLDAIRRHGGEELTNRVVRKNGSLADVPGVGQKQRNQLVREGIPFTKDLKIDLERVTPVELPSASPATFTRITVDARQMGGLPCIRSLRIPVATVVEMLAGGMSKQDVLDAYPDLELDDVDECLRYAADAVG